MFDQIKRLFTAFKSDRGGSPAIEFAIVSPLLFLAVLGTFEIGRALYDRNKIAAAAAVAMRTMAINGAADEDAMVQSIKDELKGFKADNLQIAFVDMTIDGTDFRKIEITYQHETLVKFGSRLNNVTLKAVRYAPTIN